MKKAKSLDDAKILFEAGVISLVIRTETDNALIAQQTADIKEKYPKSSVKKYVNILREYGLVKQAEQLAHEYNQLRLLKRMRIVNF